MNEPVVSRITNFCVTYMNSASGVVKPGNSPAKAAHISGVQPMSGANALAAVSASPQAPTLGGSHSHSTSWTEPLDAPDVESQSDSPGIYQRLLKFNRNIGIRSDS